MAKVHITLSMDKDCYDLAKLTDINLSSEFEEWIKIRVNGMANDIEGNKEDTELLIAQHLAEVKRLQSRAEVEKEEKSKGDVETATIDYQLDDMLKFNEKIAEPDQSRITGIQFLFKKRYNKVLNPLQAKDLLVNRAKERGLI